MVYRDPAKHDIPNKWLANSDLCPAKKGKIAILDLDWICGEYANTMLSGLHRVPSLGQRKVSVLVLGTGAGNLPMFLQSQLGDQIEKLVTVDNSEDMLKAAKTYFGFDDTLIKSVVADAHQFVMDCTDSFDIILVDLSKEFLDKLISLTNGKEFFIAMNTICYNKESQEKLVKLLAEDVDKDYLKTHQKVPNYMNTIVTLSNDATSHNLLDLRDAELCSKALEKLLADWKVKNKPLWLRDLEMKDCIEETPTIV
jgi:SAM-dependent methyltransferase